MNIIRVRYHLWGHTTSCVWIGEAHSLDEVEAVVTRDRARCVPRQPGSIHWMGYHGAWDDLDLTVDGALITPDGDVAYWLRS